LVLLSSIAHFSALKMPSGGARHARSENLRRDIADELVANLRNKTAIARAYGVSNTFVSNVASNIRAFGTPSPPVGATRGAGQPRIINAAMEDALRDMIEDWPTAILDEFVDMLRDEFDISPSNSAVRNALKRLNITRKRTTNIHPRQDPELRDAFIAQQFEYSAEQVVAVDESAANERTADRKFGWSLRGTPCRVRQSGRGASRWSILPAIGVNGYLHVEVYKGSFNALRFRRFLQRLLPQMNAYPGPRSVLLMDNCSTHRAVFNEPLLKAQVLAAGIRWLFLPPYSPDFNPIEQSFHELKNYLRRERELGYVFGDDFEGFLRYAAANICPREHARGYFRDCGWQVDEEAANADLDAYDEPGWEFSDPAELPDLEDIDESEDLIG
jgi:transposase